MLRNIFFFVCILTQALAHEKERESLLSILSGEWISRAVYVATKLNIAEHLSTPKTIEELALATQSNPESLKRLIETLASVGIFEKGESNLFLNTPKSSLLIKSHPDSLYHLSLFYGDVIHKSWDSLDQSIESGIPAFNLTFQQPVFSYFKENPEKAALFQAAMKEKSKAVIKSTLSNFDFSSFSSLIDLGGGNGQFLGSLKSLYPEKEFTLFELPEVVNKLPKTDLKVISGNFFHEVPKGYDAYLMKSVIHDWKDEEAIKILQNCHAAMEDKSRLLIVDVVLQPEAIYAHAMDLLMLAITGGKERSEEDFIRILSSAGFEMVNIVPTSTEFSIIEAKKK